MIVKYVQPPTILWDESGLEGTKARGGKRSVRCIRQPMVACLRIALSMMVIITEVDMGKRSQHLEVYQTSELYIQNDLLRRVPSRERTWNMEQSEEHRHRKGGATETNVRCPTVKSSTRLIPDWSPSSRCAT